MTAQFKDDRDAVLAELASVVDVVITPVLEVAVVAAPDRESLISQFIAAAEDNAAIVSRAQKKTLPTVVADYLRARQLPPTIVCTDDWINIDWKVAGIDAQYRAPVSEDTCGVSGVKAAAADSGAMLVTGNTPHELTVSLLPPYHIAIVNEAVIVPTTADVLAPLAAAPPHTIALFCGPSRTADIEQTLTIGAHGPVAVHVIIISENI
ncbi:LUD domain-containing protein [Candidatus Persebacteraceae bacterium Df01]|jgi:L-lactate dehydrogenase complex protein LldG|uniref:LUD domain-containing protein n=1 Tax=Candidatus Doriopsillibacter californiensis TaxID=2970740 RepID=A0ABT7QN24_9GAMM|nr:LUD domain-containing protein [Candidatus Persebacteraceae bacterium Df01]